MLVTCFYDNGCDMGYIYLKPPEDDEFDDYERSRNEISKYIDPDQINIPYVVDAQVASNLDQMVVAANTFKVDYEKGYDTEYGNDMDEEGHIIGIELTLKHETFIELVKNQAFKVIRIEWRNREYHLVTFDYSENVFKPENVIYKLTDNEDAFVIVQLVKPEKLGYQYTDEIDQKRPIALFKALISARDDIYPLEYLLKPQFLLHKDEGYLLVEDRIWCAAPDKNLWNSISSEQRRSLLDSISCEQCSANIVTLDCTVDMKSKNSFIARLYCNRCKHRFIKVVEWG
ncbi:hypothetical protein EXW96_16040 [Paenibacillus sp. JMULE4]|uniref:hypothetical protein n=1 Tax=Paenibacillus sp. JMULE4 TaxID=2518342 RepID=UPI0015750836|nr:hypothetical protein [Paenibacillus sp. JMULE4]NTZ16340.1 hypothetical protein [Paenibacillus sp. JMULE4]NTZ16363.1 hypothetical protein [Paenibacillus sp. JMULE4]NTZ19028.1 hypothetical protein [Paenibacillus sp. JMULE4]